MGKRTYIDLFAGAGGLSEGFVQEGFEPIAHVEMDAQACETLKTRIVYHFLKANGRLQEYYEYLKKDIDRATLWAKVPQQLMDSVIQAEIAESTLLEIFAKIDIAKGENEVDVIIGGPPCQAYSLVGRSRDPNRMEGDKRNYLFRYYAEFLKRYQPKVFVFENVMGLLTAGNSRYIDEMYRVFEDLGYAVDHAILNAADFGVLQKRRRVVIVGMKGEEKFDFSTLRRSVPSGSVGPDLFSDLPNLKPGEEMEVAYYTTASPNSYMKDTEIRNGIPFTTQHICRIHNSRDLEIYALAIEKWLVENERLKYTDIPVHLRTHKNTTAFLDRFKVVNPYGLSHTMVAHIAKDGHYYVHPDPKQVRSISVREAARIQSFPDDYYFEGGRTAAFRQIGNAVPPLMGKEIAKQIGTI